MTDILNNFKKELNAALSGEGVLGGHVERPLLLESGHEGSVSEVCDGLVGVVHA